MLRILVFVITAAVVSAWDPHLKIAEKIAIPHHIRHGYDYPYIDIAQMMNVRRGFSQPAPFDGGRPQNIGFRQAPVAAPVVAPVDQGRGFQSQPFEPSRGFGGSPARQTRFFQLGISPNTRPEIGGRSNSFFSRRLS